MSKYVEAIFKNRPNRFIAEVEIKGKIVKAHVPNTGRCKELLIPGVKVYLLPSDNPKRKTKYSLRYVDNKGFLVDIYSQQANEIVFNAIKDGLIKEFSTYTVFEREKTVDDSRIDIYLSGSDSENDCFVEVKGVTLIKDGLAQFPDAPTKRGCKHLKELITLKGKGYRTAVFFLVQHPAGNKFMPNWENDPEFSNILKEAIDKGVEIIIYKSVNTLNGSYIEGNSLKYVLD